MLIHAVILGTLLAAGSAFAQTTAAPPSATTGNQPNVGTKPDSNTRPIYRSVFADYRRWHDPEPISWRGANDVAAAIGGPMGQHGGHPKDGAEAPPLDAAAAKPSGMPMGEHEGHAMGHTMGHAAPPAAAVPGATPKPSPGGAK